MTIRSTAGWVTVVEAAPSIAFALMWRATGDLEAAGWLGAVLAFAVLLGFRIARIPADTIYLGINLHLAIITPLIVGLYRLGWSQPARLIEAHSFPAVLVTIFLTGCALTLWSQRGFIGQPGLPRRSSLLLLAGSAAAILWWGIVGGPDLVAVGLPIIGLFVLRAAILRRAARV
jgi:hypothetical protein